MTSSAEAAHDAEVPGVPDSDKVYLGAVKSYNDRRGFGFVACAETAAEFGRDVYMAKLEAQMAAADLWLEPGEDPQRVADKLAEMANEKVAVQLRLAEEDLVQFMVKLSVEGFPQAVKVRRMQKYTGTIAQAPEWNRDPSDNPWKPGIAVCPEVAHYCGGSGEVLVKQDACGQICFQPGDKVTFCIPQAAEPGALSEAKLVMLAHTDRPAGSVLACCRIHLPRPGAGEGKPQPAPLSLDLHAFANKVVLSGLSIDVGEAELMRFFSKQGATKGIVAHARGCSFASITFPSSADIATFLGRDAHAFADDKETRIALLLNRSMHSHTDQARLPALPAPTLRPAEEPSAIIINWTPLQLAVGYVVEMRPAGTKAEWSPVDVGRGVEPGYFSQSCSSCKVSGLRSGFAYEARVTYISSCSCRSEASDASASCAPCGEYHASRDPSYQQVPAAPAVGRAKMGPPSCQNMQSYPGLSTPTWRCVHGAVVPPPSMPEVLAGDEAGFSVAVRWPSVGHAAAYVIEFKEAGSSQTERFVRAAAPTTPGTLVELRVGGLRPVRGRVYIAQVRVVAQCGCESAPSNPAYSPAIGNALSEAPPAGGPMAPSQWSNLDQQAPASGVQMPNGFAFSNWSSGPGPMADASPLSVHIATSPEGSRTHGAETLATALQETPPDMLNPAPLIPPPDGPPGTKAFLQDFGEKAIQKELPPEVTGQEECLILD